MFGEAERGAFCTPLVCRSLPQLIDTLGNPPEESQGILYAIQTLLYERELIFFRVEAEGFSTKDYLKGIQILYQQGGGFGLAAICMPGMGNGEIIQATTPVCYIHQSFLIVNEKDLYDFLTD